MFVPVLQIRELSREKNESVPSGTAEGSELPPETRQSFARAQLISMPAFPQAGVLGSHSCLQRGQFTDPSPMHSVGAFKEHHKNTPLFKKCIGSGAPGSVG